MEEVLVSVKIDAPKANDQLKQLTGQLIAQKNEVKQLESAIKTLSKAEGDNTALIKDTTKNLEAKKQKLSQTTAQQKALVQVINSESNSLNSLRANIKLLTLERDSLNSETEEGKKRISELNDEIDEHTQKIKANSSAQEKQKMTIGAYKDEVKKAISETKVFGISLNDIGGGMSKVALGITGATALLGGLFAAYIKSTAGAKDLESAQNKLAGSFTYASNELAKLVGADGKGDGLLSRLTTGLTNYFLGASASVAGFITDSVNRSLKEIEILELTNNRVAKEQLQFSEQQRQIRDDDTKSFDERMAAAKAVDVFVNQREGALLDTQNKRLAQLRTLLALDQNNLELKKEIKQVEFEIADIQEDSEGKRTEALNGILTLEKEQIALMKERQALLDKQRADVLKRGAGRGDPDQEREQAILDLYNKIQDEKTAKDLERQEIIDGINDRFLAGVEKRDAADKKLSDAEIKRRRAEADAATKKEMEISSTLLKLSYSMKAFGLSSKVLDIGIAIRNVWKGVTEVLQSKSVLPEPGATISRIANIGTVLATGMNAVSNMRFQRGGIARGPSHDRGGIPFGIRGTSIRHEMEGGEAIINKRSTALFKRELSAINEAGGGVKFAYGGIAGNETRIAANRAESQFDINQMAGLINQVRTVLVLEDFEAKASEVAGVQNRATVIS